MRITELLNNKQNDILNCKPITIVFLGDSVTQGCFEVYLKNEREIETVYDYTNSYSTRFREILNVLYPSVQINIINSGISGDNAKGGFDRLDRDVLSYNPDLCIVSYGLNDVCSETTDENLKALDEILNRLKLNKIETVFLTQNAMCTKTSCHIKEQPLKDISKNFSTLQNEGALNDYFIKAKKLCEKHGVVVCDLYSVWEKMIENGVDITELLSNKLNHPIREYHYYIAIKLVELFFEQ